MSSKLSSPTAHLLRSSRLFSLPPALPRATSNLTINQTPDPGTLPYPVQQAIVTTPSSLARGDWGLKRALPVKATARTSTPTVRINAVDTIEHITDFESAADLTITLQRIQELNLPVTQPASTGKVRTNVFESNTDNADPTVTDASNTKSYPVDNFDGFGLESAESSRKTVSKWKYKGPWVAGMTEGEFQAYVAKELRNRRHEFMEYLRKRFAEELLVASRRKARVESALADDQRDPVQETKADISDADFLEYIKKLRGSYDLNTNLAKYVSDFLDLPSVGNQDELGIGNLTAERQPPCHPSAGISYLRSDAHLNNHPILGPRARSTPAEGRVVSPSKGIPRGYEKPEANISVAGVVSQLMRQYGEWLPSNTNALNTETKTSYERKMEKTQLRRLGVDTPGGNQGWVEPSYMGIDGRGRITMKVANADHLTVATHNGELFENVRSGAQKKRPIAAPLFSNPEQTSRKPQYFQGDDDLDGPMRSNAARNLVKDLRDGFSHNPSNDQNSS